MKIFRLIILFILLTLTTLVNANATKFNFSASITLVTKPATIDNSQEIAQNVQAINYKNTARSVNINDDVVEFIYE